VQEKNGFHVQEYGIYVLVRARRFLRTSGHPQRSQKTGNDDVELLQIFFLLFDHAKYQTAENIELHENYYDHVLAPTTIKAADICCFYSIILNSFAGNDSATSAHFKLQRVFPYEMQNVFHRSAKLIKFYETFNAV